MAAPHPALLVISAPSGGGKTTLCQRLLQDFPDIILSISSTTRLPRGTEKHGKEYFFLDKNEFEKQIKEGHFIEWAVVHGNYYGTSKTFVEEAFKLKKSVLLDIDVQGAAQLRTKLPDVCHTLFLAPPSLEELETRLKSRATDSEESIQKRLNQARIEIQEASKFDHIIVNDQLDRAYSELQNWIQQKLRLKPQEK